MLGNTKDRWGKIAKVLHWTIAAIILVQVPLGFVMADAHGQSMKDPSILPYVLKLAMVHNTLGFIVLILAAFRLGWRVSQPTPDLPAALETYQRWLARATHIFLYVLLFAFPLSGWAALSALGEFPIFFFGWDSVWPIVEKVGLRDQYGFIFFRDIHHLCWQVGGAILGLHILAALWHHLVKKDGTLRRMWF